MIVCQPVQQHLCTQSNQTLQKVHSFAEHECWIHFIFPVNIIDIIRSISIVKSHLQTSNTMTNSTQYNWFSFPIYVTCLGVVHFCVRFFSKEQCSVGSWPTHPPPQKNGIRKKYVHLDTTFIHEIYSKFEVHCILFLYCVCIKLCTERHFIFSRLAV